MERTVLTVLIQSHQHQQQLTYLLISQHVIENIVVIIKMTMNLYQSIIRNVNIGCVAKPSIIISFLNFLYAIVNGNTCTYYGNCDGLCCDVEDAYMQSSNIKKYFDSICTFDYNYTLDINGCSSSVIESKFMISLYTFGRISHLNSDGTVVPATDYELEAWIATHDNLLRKYKSKYKNFDTIYADSDDVIQLGDIEFLLLDLENYDYVLNLFRYLVVSLIIAFDTIFIKSLFLATTGLFCIVSTYLGSWLTYSIIFCDWNSFCFK